VKVNISFEELESISKSVVYYLTYPAVTIMGIMKMLQLLYHYYVMNFVDVFLRYYYRGCVVVCRPWKR
jgi:hypothetical protein